MSTICKLDPMVRVRRDQRRTAQRIARVNLARATDTLEQEFHLKMSMVLNELKFDSRRTGDAKERVLMVMLKKFGDELEGRRAERKLPVSK